MFNLDKNFIDNICLASCFEINKFKHKKIAEIYKMSLASQRERRQNAGSKMAKLMNQEEEEEDFYKTAYGGFNEVLKD
jgi:hypothetical protein